MGTGEALISFQNEKGEPEIVEKAIILPPQSMMGSIDDGTRLMVMNNSLFKGKYDIPVDRESAYEIIAAELEEENKAKELAEKMKEEEKAAKEAEKEAAKRLKEEEKAKKEREKAIKSSAGYKLGKKVVNKTIDKALNKGINSVLKSLFK